MVDLTSILNRPAEEIKAPPPKPAGHYEGFVKGYEWGKSSKKQTDYCRVFVKATSARDDVDQEQLAEVGLDAVELSRDFYITEDSVFLFKEFLEGPCGISAQGRTLTEMIPEMVGKSVVFQVSQSPIMTQTQPPMPTGRMRSEIAAFAKVE